MGDRVLIVIKTLEDSKWKEVKKSIELALKRQKKYNYELSVVEKYGIFGQYTYFLFLYKLNKGFKVFAEVYSLLKVP